MPKRVNSVAMELSHRSIKTYQSVWKYVCTAIRELSVWSLNAIKSIRYQRYQIQSRCLCTDGFNANLCFAFYSFTWLLCTLILFIYSSLLLTCFAFYLNFPCYRECRYVYVEILQLSTMSGCHNSYLHHQSTTGQPPLDTHFNWVDKAKLQLHAAMDIDCSDHKMQSKVKRSLDTCRLTTLIAARFWSHISRETAIQIDLSLSSNSMYNMCAHTFVYL